MWVSLSSRGEVVKAELFSLPQGRELQDLEKQMTDE